MFRFICVAVFLLFFGIISLILLPLEALIGKFSKKTKVRTSHSIVMWAFRCILKISGVKTTVIGEEKVPKDIPVLYVGNHRSYFDIVSCYPLVKNSTGFIAKKEMTKIPLLSNWMRNLNCQFLDRDNIKEGLKTILQCIELVKDDVSILIFPEGTRTPGNQMLPFKEGSLKIADKSGCPVIPVAITNTEEIFEQHMPRIKSTNIIIEFGDPVNLNELSKEEKKHLGRRIQDIIKGMLEKNAELVK